MAKIVKTEVVTTIILSYVLKGLIAKTVKTEAVTTQGEWIDYGE